MEVDVREQCGKENERIKESKQGAWGMRNGEIRKIKLRKKKE